MLYIILPIYYAIFAIMWFILSYLGCVIEFIITLRTSKPKYSLDWWWDGNDFVSGYIEFDSPWDYFIKSIKKLFIFKS